jgi:hypothetical protein
LHSTISPEQAIPWSVTSPCREALQRGGVGSTRYLGPAIIERGPVDKDALGSHRASALRLGVNATVQTIPIRRSEERVSVCDQRLPGSSKTGEACVGADWNPNLMSKGTSAMDRRLDVPGSGGTVRIACASTLDCEWRRRCETPHGQSGAETIVPEYAYRVFLREDQWLHYPRPRVEDRPIPRGGGAAHLTPVGHIVRRTFPADLWQRRDALASDRVSSPTRPLPAPSSHASSRNSAIVDLTRFGSRRPPSYYSWWP